MYCRTKKDRNQSDLFIQAPSPGYNDYNDSSKGRKYIRTNNQSDGPVYAKPNVHVAPTTASYSDSSEPNTASTTFSGAKMNDPEFIQLMSKLREDTPSEPPENFYYDINDDHNQSHSSTPSAIL